MYRARVVALLGALKRANTRLERSAPKFVQQQRLGTSLKQALHAAANLAHYLGIADPKQPGAAAAKAAAHRAVHEAVESLLGAIRDAGKAAGSAVHLEVLNSAQVVFVTLTSSGSSLLRWMARVDVLVVDEAAQALEAGDAADLELNPDLGAVGCGKVPSAGRRGAGQVCTRAGGRAGACGHRGKASWVSGIDGGWRRGR